MGCQTAQFKKGLATAGEAVQGFGQSVTSKFAGIVASFDLGSLLGSVPGFVMRSAEAMDQLGDTADRIGTTTDALSRLQYAAKLTGSDSEGLGDSLMKMNKNLHEAATEGGPASAVLQALGLDAKELVKLDPTAAFKKIADAIGGLKNPADKTAAAMALFGKSGGGLLNTLSAGSKELEKFEAESDALGNTISATDRIKVGNLFDQFDKLSALLAGLGQKIAAELSPYVTALIESFTTWAKTGVNSGGLVSGAVELIINAVAIGADAVDAFTYVWKSLGVIGLRGLSGILNGLALVANGIDALTSYFPGMGTSFGATLGGMADALESMADEKLKGLSESLVGQSNGDKVRDFLKGIKSGADEAAKGMADAAQQTKGLSTSFIDVAKSVTEFTDKLKAQVAGYGLSGEAAELYKLKAKGATEAQLKGAKQLIRQMEALKSIEDIATPLEKAQLAVAKLDDMFNQGLIDEATHLRGVAKIGQDLVGDTSRKRAGAMELGSAEARSTILDYAAASQDPQKDLAKTARQTLEAIHQGNSNSAKLVEEFRNLQVVTI